MKKICLFLSGLMAFALLSAAAPAFSQDKAEVSSHEKIARELYNLMGGSDTAEAGAEAMLEAMTKNNAELEEYSDVFRAWYKKVFAGDEFEAAVVRLYMKFFTEEELLELIAFYKTPVGEKTLKILPEIAKQSAAIGAARAEAHSQELVEMLMDAMAKKAQKPSDEKM